MRRRSHPTLGIRRTVDIMASSCALVYQVGLAQTRLTLAPRMAYLGVVCGGIGCYTLARRMTALYGDRDLASKLHVRRHSLPLAAAPRKAAGRTRPAPVRRVPRQVGLHVCGNLSNLLLYDALGE